MPSANCNVREDAALWDATAARELPLLGSDRIQADRIAQYAHTTTVLK
jgi:hypothetical protein